MGFAVSAAVVPPIADNYGRYWPYNISLFVQVGAYVVILFSKQVYLTIACIGVVGLCAGGQHVVGPFYMNEFLPIK